MDFKELENEVLVSLRYSPCNEDELAKRDFLKNTSLYGIGLVMQSLEKKKAVYYKKNSDIIHVCKKWMKKNRPNL